MAESLEDWPLPVSASGWDGDMECLILYDVTFKEDWGPWKIGAKIPTICIDLNSKIVQSMDGEGKLVTEVPFKLTPLTT